MRDCASIIARHPVFRLRYGKAIRYLAPVWLKLLASDGVVAAVFEEVQGRTLSILGAGIDVFVTDEFIAELKASPHFWIGPEIVSRIHRGRSPVLSDKQIRHANTTGGLTTATWHTGVLPQNISRSEVGNTIMTAFVELHRGYLLNEIVFQAETLEHVEAARKIGAFLWNPATTSYEALDSVAPERLEREPHVLGLTRNLAFQMTGSWGASTFLYHRPRFGFSRSEQKLLSCGLAGGTDEQIACKLGISLVAVRKRWRAIYERVETIAPELLPNPNSENEASGERGKTKKQVFLAYVREKAEELRPVSRKLLQVRQSGH